MEQIKRGVLYLFFCESQRTRIDRKNRRGRKTHIGGNKENEGRREIDLRKVLFLPPSISGALKNVP